MKHRGIGVDLFNNQVVGYKLYFNSTKSFLASYLNEFDLHISSLSTNKHDVVLRLNECYKLVSYKTEIRIKKEELKIFKNILINYDYFIDNFDALDIYLIAIEIENDSISKVNLYHRNYLSKRGSNGL